MIKTRQPTINRAIVHIDDERDLVRLEREAFDTFLSRVRDVQTDIAESTGVESSSTALITAKSSTATDFREIRQAYRNTVMGVSHYDEEYGDSLRESLTAELGQELAIHIVDGQTLTPTIQEYLVEAIKKARNDRDKFLDRIQRERDSLATIADNLNEIELRAVELGEQIETTEKSTRLSEIDEVLETLEKRCTELAACRQERVQTRWKKEFSGFDTVSLSQYLYNDMETVTPALTDIVSCLNSIRYKRTRCLR